MNGVKVALNNRGMTVETARQCVKDRKESRALVHRAPRQYNPTPLYINDMHRSSNQMRFIHFADDTTVFASNSDINNVHDTVNRELIGVDNWLKANRLSLNVSKTSYMIISPTRKMQLTL